MELKNEFRVPMPVSDAWALLTDVERIAPCMPGAELQEIEGEEYRGVVKVKVGPITAQYKGKATFVERDEAGGKAVLRAEGRDTRGQGNANATITARLATDGDGTQVTVTTDLTVTGRVAQFGRGVLADVSSKLLGQFVDCLEANVLGQGGRVASAAPAPAPADAASMSAAPTASAPASSPGSEPHARAGGVAVDVEERASGNGSSMQSEPSAAASASTSEDPSGVRRIQSKPAEPVDLLDAAGAPVVKRAVPAAIAALILLLLLRRRRRRRRQG